MRTHERGRRGGEMSIGEEEKDLSTEESGTTVLETDSE
jgi:hypothetical protein